jgi:hypothetical protein
MISHIETVNALISNNTNSNQYSSKKLLCYLQRLSKRNNTETRISKYGQENVYYTSPQQQQRPNLILLSGVGYIRQTMP